MPLWLQIVLVILGVVVVAGGMLWWLLDILLTSDLDDVGEDEL